MLNLESLLQVATPPTDLASNWFIDAKSGVDYLVRNACSDEIILYMNVGQCHIHSVLAPTTKFKPLDGQAIAYADLSPSNHWRLEHVSGGGQPDLMYLASPIDTFRSEGLEGGEQLIFRRTFTDVDKGPTRTEVSQRLVQALDLYWLDEEKAYCRLDENGDIEPIIRLRDLSVRTGHQSDILVTINAELLHRYMAITETAAVMKFDFTRYISGSFDGWQREDRSNVEEEDLYYNSGVQTNASFANGVLIVRPLITKDELIARTNREWKDTDKQYAILGNYPVYKPEAI